MAEAKARAMLAASASPSTTTTLAPPPKVKDLPARANTADHAPSDRTATPSKVRINTRDQQIKYRRNNKRYRRGERKVRGQAL
jgi:hypothetical protein